MKKGASILGGLLVAAAAVVGLNYATGAHKLVNQLKVLFKDITGFKIAGTSVVFNLRLDLINPSQTGLKIYSISADLNFNGQKIATPYMLQPVTISPQSSSIITIPVSITGPDVLTAILGALNSKAKGIVMDYSGYVNSNFGTIPINGSFNLI
jgi:LEA14-like dessication related protein